MSKQWQILWIILIPTCLFAQEPPINDHCTNALQIPIGAYLTNLSNATATTTLEETPGSIPITCVKSFENDMWFTFTTEEGYDEYEVLVEHTFCDVPTGLQAMIIRTDDCNPGNYIYRACSNLQNTDSIRMFLKEPQAGVKYLIYVDGYDGTICEYNLQLSGYRNRRMYKYDYLFVQNDYHIDDPSSLFEPLSLTPKFVNNEAVLEWSVDTHEEIDFFVVSRIMEPNVAKGAIPVRYGKILAVIEHQNTVGEGQAFYSFVDDRIRFQQGEKYCYKILKVDRKGAEAFTDDICLQANIIGSFYVSQVFPDQEAGKFLIKYVCNKKVDIDFRILDQNKSYIKGKKMPKEPKGEAKLTINMQDQPPGIYYLHAVSKEGEYFREFILE